MYNMLSSHHTKEAGLAVAVVANITKVGGSRGHEDHYYGFGDRE